MSEAQSHIALGPQPSAGNRLQAPNRGPAEGGELDLYPSRTGGRAFEAPRREPVVWTERKVPPPITRRALRAFERDGFVVLDDVFSVDEIAALRRNAERLSAKPEQLARETVIFEREAEDANGRPAGAVRSAFAIHRQLEAFKALSRDARLTALARHILGDDVYVNQSRLNFKPAFRGAGFFWHSDFETWHVEDGMPRMRAVSMSVMLTDNHPQSGPTMFIPGSHRTFFGCPGSTPADNYRTSLERQEHGVPSDAVLSRLTARNGLAAPTPRAGAVVVFDCNTLHGSNNNITPFERLNAFFVYNAWSNQLVAPFGGHAPRPEFLAHRRELSPIQA